MTAEHEDELSLEIFQLLKESGQLAGTDEEVEITEALLKKQPPNVPAGLADPKQVFDRITAPKVIRLAKLSSTDAEDGLARAARDGKKLSQETLLKMEEDRNQAEQQ